MKLKKIIGYIQVDSQDGVRTTIIPSGFREGYIVVEEYPSYYLEVGYNQSLELLEALKKVKKVERRHKL